MDSVESIFNTATSTWLDYKKAQFEAQGNALGSQQLSPSGQQYTDGQAGAGSGPSTTTLLLIGGGALLVVLLALRS